MQKNILQATKAADLQLVKGANGGAALLTANLDRNLAAVYALPHSIVALSGGASMELSQVSRGTQTLKRRLKGGPWLLHRVYSDSPASLLIAPRLHSDITTVDVARLSDSTLVIPDGRHFLAMSGGGAAAGMRMETKWRRGLEIQGSGVVALSAYGSLSRVDLQPGEEWAVSGRHLVAYSSPSSPAHFPVDSLPFAVDSSASGGDGASLFAVLQRWAIQSVRRWTLDPVKRARLWFLGAKEGELLRVQGPGVFILSSRSAPRLNALFGAVAEMQYQGSLLRESWKRLGSSSAVPALLPVDRSRGGGGIVASVGDGGKVSFSSADEVSGDIFSSAVGIKDKASSAVDNIKDKAVGTAVNIKDKSVDAYEGVKEKSASVVEEVLPKVEGVSKKSWRQVLFGPPSAAKK